MICNGAPWYATTEWWTMFWTAVQAVAVAATVLFLWRQVGELKTQSRIDRTIAFFEKFSVSARKAYTRLAVEASRAEPRSRLKTDRLHALIAQSEKTGYDSVPELDPYISDLSELVNYFNAAYDNIQRGVIEDELFLGRADTIVVASYILTEDALGELKAVAPISYESFRQLAVAEQNHYRARAAEERPQQELLDAAL